MGTGMHYRKKGQYGINENERACCVVLCTTIQRKGSSWSQVHVKTYPSQYLNPSKRKLNFNIQINVYIFFNFKLYKLKLDFSPWKSKSTRMDCHETEASFDPLRPVHPKRQPSDDLKRTSANPTVANRCTCTWLISFNI